KENIKRKDTPSHYNIPVMKMNQQVEAFKKTFSDVAEETETTDNSEEYEHCEDDNDGITQCDNKFETLEEEKDDQDVESSLEHSSADDS
ncbi:hypothetical protein MAR_035130, partial [Mya arenaria]